MADNRFSQVPGYGGGRYQVNQQNAAVHNVPGMAMYMQGGMPMNPMLQQQMMMASGMRFPMQGMGMGPPSTPPPPYSAHSPGPGVTNLSYRPRTSLNKSKDGHQSEKERFYEEQRQKLKQFGKAGSTKVDAEKLIGPIFSADEKSQHSKRKTENSKMSRKEDVDDGFGDFLQGPSSLSSPSSTSGQNDSIVSQNSCTITSPEPDYPESQEEKKDLTSMMLEFSDLTAPKKAKGFHKPTLNEVQKSGQKQHRVNTVNIHESDHSRSWKQNMDDLEGLFQIPVAPPKQHHPAQAVSTIPSQPHHYAYVSQQVVTSGLPPLGATVITGSIALTPPSSGPPPTYGEVIGNPMLISPNNTPLANNAYTSAAVNNPGADESTLHGRSPASLPEWFLHTEDQLPPVYKQVYEASHLKGMISTERLYPILLLSGLQRDKLAQIWSLCNTATPGQLAKSELWLVLALIALTQNNYQTNSLDILARCPVAPIPVFAQVQDTNSPATLPTTPEQHKTHPPSQFPAPASSEPPAQQQQQPHLIKQPKPQHGSSPPPATAAGATSPATDDDFAEFQHAVPAANTSSVSYGKDEAFGEFIGGSGKSGFNSSPLPVHGQMGNGSVVMGHSGIQPQFYQPQQQHDVRQQQQQQQPEALPSLPVDDKYGTNVRSFFCSSDSSAGHTSPSFEDDDFTDGRDSLSQVSTSEPSENEDIRNFENYVEEFHQQKGKPDGSPLHCPFPTIQQKQAGMATKGQAQAALEDTNHSGKLGAPPRLHLSSLSPVPEKNSRNTNVGFKQTQDSNSDFTDFKSAATSFKITSAVSTGPGSHSNVRDPDFADFKSVPFQSTSDSDAQSSNDVSLIGDEDKYGALRALGLGSEFTQHSLFEEQDHSSSPALSKHKEESVTNEEDDWADFSSATNANEKVENQNFSVSPEANSSSQSLSSNKENILKLFNSSQAQDQVDFTAGNTYQDENKQDIGWSKHDADNRWTGLSREDGGDGLYLHGGMSTNTFSRGASNMSFSRSADGAASSSIPVHSYTTKVEDDWRLFAPGAASMHDMPAGLSDETRAQNHRNSSGDASNVNAEDNLGEAEEDDWCDFSAASPGGGAARAGAGVEEETELGGSSENMVTIKKKNLVTSEIMGLFKVRDDPATMSSYQLPTQLQTSKSSSRHGSHHSSTPSHRHQRSLDLDDDMGPPPLDFGHDDEYDDHVFSRGYDLDDYMQRAPPATVYNPFGISQSGAVYSQSGGTRKLKENKEDSASVHSLDLPSARPVDLSGSDSQSVSSADLAGAEVAGGVVSVESKSVDSLDLRSENGEYDGSEVGSREDSSSTQHHHHHHHHQHPIQPQELLATMPDFADKYNIEREAQGSDRYGWEWERCLSNCYRIISEANTLLNTVSSSSVCNEVLKSVQGSEYVSSVIEIYRVVCRILTSLRSTAISTTEVEQTLKSIDLAWNNLSAFLAGASLLPKAATLVFTNCILKSDSEHAQGLACGVCLLNVDARPLSDLTDANSYKLTYAGRQYHATCANFWVNCVDQTLPSLTLPDLL